VGTFVNRLAVPENALEVATGTPSFCEAVSTKSISAWGELKGSSFQNMS
jgi:hypothetical protein